MNMIEATPIVNAISTQTLEPASQRPIAEPLDFGKVLGGGLHRLDTDINASNEVLRSMAAGQDIPVHDVMIVMERAKLSLEFAVQLRNRLVSAYQQITQMQV